MVNVPKTRYVFVMQQEIEVERECVSSAAAPWGVAVVLLLPSRVCGVGGCVCCGRRKGVWSRREGGKGAYPKIPDNFIIYLFVCLCVCVCAPWDCD